MHRILHEGQKERGRFIYLKKRGNLISMSFYRFLSEITPKKYKSIGFHCKGESSKQKIFKKMIRSLADFTIDKSYCHLFFEDDNCLKTISYYRP